MPNFPYEHKKAPQLGGADWSMKEERTLKAAGENLVEGGYAMLVIIGKLGI